MSNLGDYEKLKSFAKSLTKDHWRFANRMHFALLEMHPRDYHTITQKRKDIKGMSTAFWPDDESKQDLFVELVIEGVGL